MRHEYDYMRLHHQLLLRYIRASLHSNKQGELTSMSRREARAKDMFELPINSTVVITPYCFIERTINCVSSIFLKDGRAVTEAHCEVRSGFRTSSSRGTYEPCANSKASSNGLRNRSRQSLHFAYGRRQRKCRFERRLRPKR